MCCECWVRADAIRPATAADKCPTVCSICLEPLSTETCCPLCYGIYDADAKSEYDLDRDDDVNSVSGSDADFGVKSSTRTQSSAKSNADSPSSEAKEAQIAEKHKDKKRIVEAAATIKRCGHVFGYTCLSRWMEESNTCPMCRTEAFSTIRHDKTGPLDEEDEAEDAIDADVANVEVDLDVGVEAVEQMTDVMQHLALGFLAQQPIERRYSEVMRECGGDRLGASQNDVVLRADGEEEQEEEGE